MSELSISGRRIGDGHRPYFIAELSANHGGSLSRALAVMAAAKDSGADAIKLQTYTPDTMTIDHDGPDFCIGQGPWAGRRLYELYQEAHTPWEWHKALFEKGRELGLPVFSTPFDDTAVDFLESLNTPAYKIASFELVDHALISRVARTGKPTIISTGMGSLDEISEAVDTFRLHGGRDLVLLHCISGYPTPADQSNLRRIPELLRIFGCPVGLSDHTLEPEVAIAGVALGACMVEKHFTLRRDEGGPDAAFSLEPSEFLQLTQAARTTFEAIGSGSPERSAVESSNKIFRRSIYAIRDIGPGEVFTSANVKVIRPGFGLPPKELPNLLGRLARAAIARGTALTWDLIE